jgi:hypothetical protein
MTLQDLRTLTDAATPPPWDDAYSCRTCDALHVKLGPKPSPLGPPCADVDATEADWKFIAAARTAMPLLLRIVEGLPRCE